jgi:penicillin amidase
LDPLPITGFVGLPRVRSFEEFRKCQADWPFLPLNMLYADVEGKTAYQLVGTLPRRKSGAGLVPRPADRVDAGWDGYLPFDEMPSLIDPGPGFFATANNDPTPNFPHVESESASSPLPRGEGAGGKGLWLGADYCDNYRHRAVTEALALGEKWSVEQCLALQLDVRCIPWEEVRDTILALSPADSDARDGLELLRAWDGRVDSESPAACVFELFMAQMCQRVARARAPREWRTVLGENGLGGSGHTLFTDRRIGHLVRLIRAQTAGWFASWPKEMESVLAEVVRKLRREVGPAPAYWAWGHLRQLRLEHPLFGKHRRLAAAFNLGPVPCGGDCNTVNQAGARPADPTDFTHNMCNMRAVFDLADLDASRFVLCGGQSGNPWSPHHGDQFPLWQAGESIAIAWEQADVIRAARETLRLLPSPELAGNP